MPTTVVFENGEWYEVPKEQAYLCPECSEGHGEPIYHEVP